MSIIMSLVELSNYDASKISLGSPKSVRNDGKFYPIRYVDESGQKGPMCFGTSYCPIRTYGINKWGSIFLYADSGNDDGVNGLLRVIRKVESDVEKMLRSKGVTASLSSRISNRLDDSVRISAKPIYQSEGIVAPVIKDLEEKILTADELKKGDAFDMYPIIRVDSIFVNKSKGIILQLKIAEAFVQKVAPRVVPKLDLLRIRKRYEHVHILRTLSFTNDKDEPARIEE